MAKRMEKIKNNLFLSVIFLLFAFYPAFAAKPANWSDTVLIGAVFYDADTDETSCYIMIYNATGTARDIGLWDFAEYQLGVLDGDWPITIDGGTTIDAYSFCLLGDGANPIDEADWPGGAVVPDYSTTGSKIEQGADDGWCIRDSGDTIKDGIGMAGTLPGGCPDTDGMGDITSGRRYVRYNQDGPARTVGEGYGIDTNVNTSDVLEDADPHDDRPHNSSETEIPEWSGAQGDEIAPAGISSLSALAGLNDGTVRLKWICPGDDGTGGGDVVSYEVKWATFCIDSVPDYDAATTYDPASSWPPGDFGTEHAIQTVSDLTDGVTYWFAIKGKDGTNTGMWPGSYGFGSYTGGTIADINCYHAADFIPDTGFISPSSHSNENGRWNSIGNVDPDRCEDEGNAYVDDAVKVRWNTPGTIATGDPYYADHSWGGFDFSTKLGVDDIIDGIEIVIMDGEVTSAAGTDKFHVAFYSKNNGGAHDVWGWSGSTKTLDVEAATPGTNYTFGGSADQWGLTNPTGVDFGPNTSFKVRVTVESSSKSDDFYFDHIKVKICYTPVAGDETPPAGISSLSALAGLTAETVRLKWICPGDDGTGGGNVSSYEVKRATFCIDSAADYTAAITYSAA